MDIINLFSEYVPWSWIVGGLVLLAVELVAPGGVFLWLGGSAIVTGLITLIAPFSVPFQFVIFGALSIGAIAGWLAYRRRVQPLTDAPFLNDRAGRFVGKEGFLSEPILGQRGRMELGDSVWRVTGPELPAGHRVRVVGHKKGNILEVESAETDRVVSA